MRYAIALAVIVVPSLADAQQPARWSVDPTPLLTLGESQADTNDMFTQVVGATRLPDGRVMVGDYGSYALRMYAADGKLLRRFGRKGGGPGEIGYLAGLLRCGDSVVTLDIDGNRTSVFSLGGDFARMFRFSSPQPSENPGQSVRPPYRTTCNARGSFAHYGWENLTDLKNGAYRAMVPLWISKADSVKTPVIAMIAGSERFGRIVDGRPAGSGPLPLGKQTAIALGGDRVYVATGEHYEIDVYDLQGKALTPLREAREVRATTRADIDYVKGRSLAAAPEARRAAIERFYETMPFPKTIPAYASLVIDRSGHIWAQEHPRGTSPAISWTVFDANGRQVATAALPAHLDVYEIGTDYVLGRFLDPDESIPQVRMYRLRRGG